MKYHPVLNKYIECIYNSRSWKKNVLCRLKIKLIYLVDIFKTSEIPIVGAKHIFQLNPIGEGGHLMNVPFIECLQRVT